MLSGDYALALQAARVRVSGQMARLPTYASRQQETGGRWEAELSDVRPQAQTMPLCLLSTCSFLSASSRLCSASTSKEARGHARAQVTHAASGALTCVGRWLPHHAPPHGPHRRGWTELYRSRLIPLASRPVSGPTAVPHVSGGAETSLRSHRCTPARSDGSIAPRASMRYTAMQLRSRSGTATQHSRPISRPW